MKIALPWEQFSDDEGRPLVGGRVSVYKHDSDILAEVFTLEGDIYSAAPNPFLTADDGRIPTIWFEASVVDVRLEKRNADGTFEPLDTFQAGFEVEKATNASSVIGIDALKSVNPEVGMVKVVGYHNDHDCPERLYIWDANCTQDPDGGVIVESTIGEEGRWLLVYDDEKLPSSFYGIVPGSNEANMMAFLGYPTNIGTYSIPTPPIPRFLKGRYITAGTMITDKTLYFDKGAYFNTGSIECHSVIIPENDTYVADFYFTKQNVAMASWFRSTRAFFGCNAAILRYGKEDFFENRIISTAVVVNNATFEGSRRINATFTNGAYLDMRFCVFDGIRMFSPRYDYIRFNNMTWNQAAILPLNISQYDFGRVTDGHRFEYLSTGNNSLDIENFPNTEVYVAMRAANESVALNPNRTLFLHNRHIANLTSTVFTEIHDVIVTGRLNVTSTHATTGSNYLTLVNVECTNEVYIDTENLTTRNCRLRFFGEQGNIDTFTSNDSVLTKSGLNWTRDTRFSIEGGEWSIGIVVADDDVTDSKSCSFANCDVLSATLKHKHLNFRKCNVVNCTITVHPYKDGDEYRTAFSATDSVFNSNNAIRFDKHASDDVYDTVHDVIPYILMTNNSFTNASGIGLWIRFWSHPSVYTTYFKAGANTGATIIYINNNGYCPQDSFSGAYGSWVQHDIWGTTLSTNQYVSFQIVRTVPKYPAVTSLVGTLYSQKPCAAGVVRNGGETLNIIDMNPGYLGQFVNTARYTDLIEGGDEHEDWNDLCNFSFIVGSNTPANSLLYYCF